MNSAAAYRRHDISDKAWEILEPHLPGRTGTKGRPAHDNRNFINAVFWILRTGVPWRDLPPDYEDWENTNRRFCRWRDRRCSQKELIHKAIQRICIAAIIDCRFLTYLVAIPRHCFNFKKLFSITT